MEDIDWDFFYKQLEAGYHIDETCFYFSDDAEEEVHYIGLLPNMSVHTGLGTVIYLMVVNLVQQRN